VSIVNSKRVVLVLVALTFFHDASAMFGWFGATGKTTFSLHVDTAISIESYQAQTGHLDEPVIVCDSGLLGEHEKREEIQEELFVDIVYLGLPNSISWVGIINSGRVEIYQIGENEKERLEVIASKSIMCAIRFDISLSGRLTIHSVANAGANRPVFRLKVKNANNLPAYQFIGQPMPEDLHRNGCLLL
jgi:hypothetical protein